MRILFEILANFIKKEWFPFCTLLLTLATLVVSILERARNEDHYKETTRALIEHDKLSLAPLMDLRLEELSNKVELYIKNVGEGPATILSVDFFYQGQQFPDMKEFMIYLTQRGDFLNHDNDSTLYGGSGITVDHLNLEKDEKWPLLMEDHSPFEYQLRLSRIFDSTGTKITYIDLYNDTLKREFNQSIIHKLGYK